MQDKWPKCVRENQEKSTHRTHPNCTHGTQRIKHQLVINAPYTEYEASDRYVFISFNRRNSNKGAIDELEIYDRH